MAHSTTSGTHAVLAVRRAAKGAGVVVPSTLEVRDAKSRCGTMVNGKKVAPDTAVELKDGDTVRFGAGASPGSWRAGGVWGVRASPACCPGARACC